MAAKDEITSLEQLVERIDSVSREESRTTLDGVIKALGRRSFGPILLLSGLITLSPIGDIPGTPTVMALLVALIAGQLLARRDYFWLPQWLLKRSISRKNLAKILKWLRRPARFIDRFLKPRLTYFTTSSGAYAVAFICLIIALAMPPMELVPFTATGAGIALAAFGLALVARDGLLALVAFVMTMATVAVVLYQLL